MELVKLGVCVSCGKAVELRIAAALFPALRRFSSALKTGFPCRCNKDPLLDYRQKPGHGTGICPAVHKQHTVRMYMFVVEKC